MSTGYFPLFGSSSGKTYGNDLESGDGLYPGIGETENMLRLGFIQKVFGIVSAQLLMTATVAGVLMLSPSAQHYLAHSIAIQIFLMIGTLVGLIPLYMYKDNHPLNMFILAGWTGLFSIMVGLSCTFYQPAIVIQALIITIGIVAGLTAYTFWATKRGYEFTWLGPLLGAMLWGLIIWGFVQMFFRPGPIGSTIYSLLGALVFSGYIVFDVQLLATRLDVDDYVWGSVALYLDIINLFMYILRLLGDHNRN